MLIIDEQLVNNASTICQQKIYNRVNESSFIFFHIMIILPSSHHYFYKILSFHIAYLGRHLLYLRCKINVINQRSDFIYFMYALYRPYRCDVTSFNLPFISHIIDDKRIIRIVNLSCSAVRRDQHYQFCL